MSSDLKFHVSVSVFLVSLFRRRFFPSFPSVECCVLPVRVLRLRFGEFDAALRSQRLA